MHGGTGNYSKIQEPTTVITADGKVQTSEEPQVNVHDHQASSAKNTVPPTRGPVVKKPHLTKNGIRILWNTEYVVPIVVPALSPSSSASSSSTSLPQDSSRYSRVQQDYEVTIPKLKHRENRGDPPKIKTRPKKKNRQATSSRLRDLPEWLFTDNLEDAEVPASAKISQDSDSEHLTKWQPGSIVFTLTSPKTKIAKYASEQRL